MYRSWYTFRYIDHFFSGNVMNKTGDVQENHPSQDGDIFPSSLCLLEHP